MYYTYETNELTSSQCLKFIKKFSKQIGTEYQINIIDTKLMEMKWIHSKGPKGNKVWLEDIVNVKAITWDEAQEGDIVFIAGNLKDNIPTAVYGRHVVVDPKKQILINGNDIEFYERWPFVYKEII